MVSQNPFDFSGCYSFLLGCVRKLVVVLQMISRKGQFVAPLPNKNPQSSLREARQAGLVCYQDKFGAELQRADSVLSHKALSFFASIELIEEEDPRLLAN